MKQDKIRWKIDATHQCNQLKDFQNPYPQETGQLMRCYNQVEDFQNPYPHETGQDPWES